MLRGRGTATVEAPITVHFAPGRYDFYPTNTQKRRYYISKSNGDPEGEKAIAILIADVGQSCLQGPGARIVCRGKMIELCVDQMRDGCRDCVGVFLNRSRDLTFRPNSAVHRNIRITDNKFLMGKGWPFRQRALRG